MKNKNRIIHFISHPYFLIFSFSVITFVGEKLSFPLFIFLLGFFNISPDTSYLTTISGITGLLGILLCYISTYRPFEKGYILGIAAMLISLICLVLLNTSHVFFDSINHPVTYCTIGIFLSSAVLSVITNFRLWILDQKEANLVGHSELAINPNVKSGILTLITSPVTLLISYLIIVIPDQGLPLPFLALIIIGSFKHDFYAIFGLVGFLSCIVSRFYFTRFLHIVSIIMLNIPIMYMLFGSASSGKVIQTFTPFFYVAVCLFIIISLIGLVYRIMPSLFVKAQK